MELDLVAAAKKEQAETHGTRVALRPTGETRETLGGGLRRRVFDTGSMTTLLRRAGLLSAAAASLAPPRRLRDRTRKRRCAQRPGSDDVATPDGVIAAPGQVIGQGTVIQTGDTPPQFCLGPVMESYPPQCSGPEIVGWDWDAVEGDETAGDVTFGAYAIWGTWDGTVFTATESVMLALYDPMPIVDPLLDPENAGDTPEAELTRIQDELTESSPFPILSSGQMNGYLFVDVIYDDGSIQAWVDSAVPARHGRDPRRPARRGLTCPTAGYSTASAVIGETRVARRVGAQLAIAVSSAPPPTTTARITHGTTGTTSPGVSFSQPSSDCAPAQP